VESASSFVILISSFRRCGVLAILGFSRNVPTDMQLTLLKSKLHRATVTGASLHYEGSMTISQDLAERVGLLPYEKILVGNMGNGERFETYVIYGEAGTGQIQLNGATAHLGKIGDRLTIMNFGSLSEQEAVGHKPRVLVLNEKNEVVRYDSGSQQEEFQVVV
jgi:aspartate 1-decarboxylase